MEESTSKSLQSTHIRLVERIARQDETALTAFYDATADRVYGFALSITGNPEAAEEVTGDVYWQVWQQAQRYDSARAAVMTWLMTICRSRALDSFRSRDPAETHPDPEQLCPEGIRTDQTPLDLLIVLERDSMIYNAVETLDTQHRTLLALAFFRGLSHQEIATYTGMPLGTVKSTLRRAMESIKQVLDKQDMSTLKAQL
jgi:RNA polymerase sigma-70 factor (ECF subfamily)